MSYPGHMFEAKRQRYRRIESRSGEAYRCKPNIIPSAKGCYKGRLPIAKWVQHAMGS